MNRTEPSSDAWESQCQTFSIELHTIIWPSLFKSHFTFARTLPWAGVITRWSPTRPQTTDWAPGQCLMWGVCPRPLAPGASLTRPQEPLSAQAPVLTFQNWKAVTIISASAVSGEADKTAVGDCCCCCCYLVSNGVTLTAEASAETDRGRGDRIISGSRSQLPLTPPDTITRLSNNKRNV